MKIKFILILLIGAFWQLAEGSKRKTSKNRLMSFAKYTLALAYLSTSNVNAIGLECPSKLPPNAELIMNQIRCSDHQPSFYAKYLSDEPQKCAILFSLYDKVQGIGKCTAQTSMIIYDGAMARIFGEELTREKQQDMMENWLKNLDGLNKHAVTRFLDVFARKKNADFFQVQRASEFFSDQGKLSPEDSVKRALRKECVNLDFDQVSRMMPYARLMYKDTPNENDQALETALNHKYQGLDFEKVGKLAKIIDAVNPEEHYWTAKFALDSKYQKLDFDKVELMIPYTNAMKPFHSKGSSVYYGQLIPKVLLNQKYQNVDFDKVSALKQKIEKINPEDDKWAVKFALDERYHGLDFKQIDYMIPYANKMKPFHLGYDDELIEKVLLNKKYQKLDFEKVHELENKINKVNPHEPRWTARFVLDEKYLSYDFAKVDRMIPYANALKSSHSSGSRVHYEDIIPKILLNKKYQKLDFDKVDGLKEKLTKINPDETSRIDSRTAKIALNYENYDFDKIEKAIGLFKTLFKLNSFSFSQATESWVQNTSLAKVKEMVEEAKTLGVNKIENEFTLKKEWKSLVSALKVKKYDL